MTPRRAVWITPPRMNLLLSDGVGNLRDPRVGNIMTLDNLMKISCESCPKVWMRVGKTESSIHSYMMGQFSTSQ